MSDSKPSTSFATNNESSPDPEPAYVSAEESSEGAQYYDAQESSDTDNDTVCSDCEESSPRSGDIEGEDYAPDERSRKKDFERLKMTVRALMITLGEPATYNKIMKCYKRIKGHPLPLGEFQSLPEAIRAMPDVVVIDKKKNIDKLYLIPNAISLYLSEKAYERKDNETTLLQRSGLSTSAIEQCLWSQTPDIRDSEKPDTNPEDGAQVEQPTTSQAQSSREDQEAKRRNDDLDTEFRNELYEEDTGPEMDVGELSSYCKIDDQPPECRDKKGNIIPHLSSEIRVIRGPERSLWEPLEE